MINRTAGGYLHSLSELLLSVQVTDRKGTTLSLEEGTARAVDMLVGVGAARKVMLIGNGGSAAIVSHMQNDLCKAVRVRAMVFNEPPLLTALSNDHGYACVFERPIELWTDPGDVLLAVSSSGRSENILRGVRAAAGRGCQIITLSGFGADNPLRRMGEVNCYVPSEAYGFVEVAHAALTHCLIDRAVIAQRETRGQRD